MSDLAIGLVVVVTLLLLYIAAKTQSCPLFVYNLLVIAARVCGRWDTVSVAAGSVVPSRGAVVFSQAEPLPCLPASLGKRDSSCA